jgi:hypothetical protein
MSQASDIFYDLLKPEIVNLGFQYKKGKKNAFEKKVDELTLSIYFSWDGRGGTTFLNFVSGCISVPYVKKASAKFTSLEYSADIWPTSNLCPVDLKIPQMYSKELIQLANNMAFKKMSALPFEEKYPMVKITNTVAFAKKQIVENIIPFHALYSTDDQILNHYIQLAKDQFNKKDFYNLFYYVIPIKVISKKLKIVEPDFVQNINIFTNKSIDELWNIQDHDFDNMEANFNALKF